MRESASFRPASGPVLGAALAAVILSTTGCPSAQSVQDARAAPALRRALQAGDERPVPPGTGVRTTVDVQYYDIAGRSERDLLIAMQRSGPQWAGRRFFGLTNTALQYGYRHAVEPRTCWPVDVSILVEVTVTLPRWESPHGTPYALDRDWRAFERALRRHEDGHGRLAEQEAAALDRELGGLRAATCVELDAYANQLADDVRARFAAQHEAYDRQTEHGRSQGAAWPRE
jgi:predicted secreted Zn-dependent protease